MRFIIRLLIHHDLPRFTPVVVNAVLGANQLEAPDHCRLEASFIDSVHPTARVVAVARGRDVDMRFPGVQTLYVGTPASALSLKLVADVDGTRDYCFLHSVTVSVPSSAIMPTRTDDGPENKEEAEEEAAPSGVLITDSATSNDSRSLLETFDLSNGGSQWQYFAVLGSALVGTVAFAAVLLRAALANKSNSAVGGDREDALFE